MHHRATGFAAGLLAAVTATAGCSSGGGSTPTKAPRTTATDVVATLKTGGLPIAETIVYTAATDPNHLLGHSHQYTSKANWHDTRLAGLDTGEDPGTTTGGSVEVFRTAGEAKVREKYIEATEKQLGPLAGPPDYLYLHGGVLVRVSGKLTEQQAAGYESTLTKTDGLAG